MKHTTIFSFTVLVLLAICSRIEARGCPYENLFAQTELSPEDKKLKRTGDESGCRDFGDCGRWRCDFCSRVTEIIWALVFGAQK